MDVKASTMYQAAPIQSQPPLAAQPAAAPAAAVQKPSQTRSSAPANEPRKVKFSVGRDYQVMTVIGEGAYGVVVRAVHRASGREVAIKKVSARQFLASWSGNG
jgi:serine/threonine protein kinase